jgi:hypothetical protein
LAATVEPCRLFPMFTNRPDTQACAMDYRMGAVEAPLLKADQPNRKRSE